MSNRKFYLFYNFFNGSCIIREILITVFGYVYKTQIIPDPKKTRKPVLFIIQIIYIFSLKWQEKIRRLDEKSRKRSLRVHEMKVELSHLEVAARDVNLRIKVC